MDLFVFVSGYILGSFAGATVGVLTWLVYGTINPYGFNFPTLIATCIGESLYGIFGGVLSKSGFGIAKSTAIAEKEFWETNFKMGVVGFLLTFVYDFFTNIVTGIVFGASLVPYIIAGVPFAIVHEVSNFFFFFFGCSVLINAIKKTGILGR
ncbi:hypothetical protein KEJ18_05930 [Candidatus Bathyarchaeota archaeon]|nr:hypothetical protein [Candidatus Bathyarchaeota archaeon]